MLGGLWEGVDEVWLCPDASHACTGEKVSGWMAMLELKLTLELELEVQREGGVGPLDAHMKNNAQMRQGEVAGQETNQTDGEPGSLSLL